MTRFVVMSGKHGAYFHLHGREYVAPRIPRSEVKKKLLTLTWVDRMKDGSVRSRLCVHEFHNGPRQDVFAAMPSSSGARIMEMLAVKKGYDTQAADVVVAF